MKLRFTDRVFGPKIDLLEGAYRVPVLPKERMDEAKRQIKEVIARAKRERNEQGGEMEAKVSCDDV